MATDRDSARQHANWLSLIETSGPFLSMPVLLETFPQGLDQKENESEVRHRLRLAYEEWADNQAGTHPDPAIHMQWLRFILDEVLEMRPDTILEGQQISVDLRYEAREYGETIRPQLVIRSPFESQPRLLIQQYSYGQKLEKTVSNQLWKASPATRMMELLRASNVRLGLITNGEHWMLIDAPPAETTGYYSWYSTLWLEEALTLRAFRSLLGMERFFNVPADETLEALLTKSALRQQEVTTQLGDQVRRAVETLVRTLDRLDKDSQGSLLHSITEKALYEAALTVMMRLVFLLSAEEREMLLLGDALYDQNYAVSTMHKQLREQADQQGEEVLGLRYDAWSRLLAVFRLVYGGVEYHDLHMPAYGGHLFDPDRFPFLEGRRIATSWRDVPAEPLRIDNRTVLHLLNALQYLQVKLPGGGIEPRRLSFRGLDIEQIGHVYEGLLDHTARRVTTTILSLIGTGDSEPESTLDDLEKHASKGHDELLTFLHDTTGRSVPSLQKLLDLHLNKQDERSRLMAACDNRQNIFDRVQPFAGLLRKDTFGNYLLVTPGSVYVTHGEDRRSTGTHYTPRSLTEPIVQHTLDPLVYIGPAEGLPEHEWRLRPAAEILDLKVCDMAMGSGAFLVQTCRYLSEKLVLAWENAEQAMLSLASPTADLGRGVSLRPPGSSVDASITINTMPKIPIAPRPQITPTGQPSQGQPGEELLPADRDERLALARRLVSERCLYGVDKNPMAVEMAKLSLWLITLAKNRPFTFLDHALRSGDSLLGADERQLSNGSLDAKSGVVSQMSQISTAMSYVMPTVIQKRRQIATLTDRDIHDIETKERLLKEADQALEIVKLGADLLIAIALNEPKKRTSLQDVLGMEYVVLAKGYDEALRHGESEHGWAAKRDGFKKMRDEVDGLLKGRKPFHWPLEFPEVFVGKGDDGGFAAIVGNPPFQGGTLITGVLGTDYREYLVNYIAQGKRGARADLCSYFFLRATKLTQHRGDCGLLATSTIAQGDTREVGLDQILEADWIIPRAVSSREWPGTASLQVAHVWLHNDYWNGPYVLNDLRVEGITSYLTPGNIMQGKPFPLVTNMGLSFNGVKVYGQGFVLDIEEAQKLVQKDPHNKDVLFPYLNGEDLNTRPDLSASRWVINFHDWPLERAETYADCINIVKEKVKPERQRKNDKGQYALRKPLPEKWWIYADKRPALYSTITNMKKVLVRTLTGKHHAFAFVNIEIVFDQTAPVYAFENFGEFTTLQSDIHREWAINYGSSLGTTLRYIPSDCFETFPFPTNTDNLNDIGERYYTHRQSIMLTRQEGLTKTYNRFHNPDEHAPDIVKLRELHKEMDEAVAHAYGWDDLKLQHGFHDTKQGLRYTISEEARREVLDRLLLLNHQRHEEEVLAGLFEKGAKGKGKKGTRKVAKNGGVVMSEGNGVGAQFTSPSDVGVPFTNPSRSIIGEDDVQQGTLF